MAGTKRLFGETRARMADSAFLRHWRDELWIFAGLMGLAAVGVLPLALILCLADH